MFCIKSLWTKRWLNRVEANAMGRRKTLLWFHGKLATALTWFSDQIPRFQNTSCHHLLLIWIQQACIMIQLVSSAFTNYASNILISISKQLIKLWLSPLMRLTLSSSRRICRIIAIIINAWTLQMESWSFLKFSSRLSKLITSSHSLAHW